MAQSAILELYDPDRSGQPVMRDGEQAFPRSWSDFEAFARKHFRAGARDGNTLGDVALTFAHDGTVGNELPIEVRGTVAGVTIALTAMTGGAISDDT